MCLNSFKWFGKYLERPEAAGSASSVLRVCRAVFLSPFLVLLEGLVVPVPVERGQAWVWRE